MPPYLTHQQFSFSARQRSLMLQLAENVRLSLQENYKQSTDEEATNRTPLAPLNQLLQELAKFTYHVADEQNQKVSLSTPLLILFLFELMQLLNPNLHETNEAQAAAGHEQLRLYYLLSIDFTYHFTMRDYWGFIDQFRPALEAAAEARYERQFVNTAGMNEVAVFTALYNAAKPQGRGYHQDDPRDITEEEGAKFYNARTIEWDEPTEDSPLVSLFDYVNGRLMKISRSGIEKGHIDVTTYDQYNGAGTAQRAVEHLPRI